MLMSKRKFSSRYRQLNELEIFILQRRFEKATLVYHQNLRHLFDEHYLLHK
jgi:hypothetical protein